MCAVRLLRVSVRERLGAAAEDVLLRVEEAEEAAEVPALRALLTERLAAAAEEIVGLLEETVAEHEQRAERAEREVCRQRRLLEAVLKPDVRLQRADVQHLLENKEQKDWHSNLDQQDPVLSHIKEDQEDPEPPHIKEDQEDPEPPHIKEDQEDPKPPHIKEEQEDPVLSHIKEDQEDPEPPHIKENQEDPEPPHIKEEQEDLWTNQEGEQLEGLEEAGIRFSFSPVKSEDDEEEAQSSHLHQRLTKHMETEVDGEDYRGPGPDRSCPQFGLGCWLVDSQLLSLIGNQSAAAAAGIRRAELEENGR
ncbi:hypothetical protein EYF80_032428 [Liparis tanakae]|uniref:Uncharacterized protein n=1 Tax=Liparis tanakae TaxID=230148 RepID=A0A4Z2GXH5_9TELE|nr:hypothetical protein EYF80_032428 [Liparis tanakae]